MRTRSRWVIGILLAAGLVLGGASAPASAQGSMSLFGGFYQPYDKDADRTEAFGIRGGYRFHPSFGVEAHLDHVDLADALRFSDAPFPGLFDFNFQVDLYNFDLSLQWLPHGGRLIVFGGPGVARLDTDVEARFLGQRFTASDTKNILTAHLGLAYEWSFSHRLFLRPEFRARRYFDDENQKTEEVDDLTVTYKGTAYQAGLAFGWRIGK